MSSQDHEHSTTAGLDLSKIRAGDEVTVRMIVADDIRNGCSDYRGLSYLACENPYERCAGSIIVLASNIASHTPTALAVGDRVRRPMAYGDTVYRIEHIADGWCWIKNEATAADDFNRGRLSPLDGLERAS